MVSTAITLNQLSLSSPFMLASGTCGYGTELEELIDINALGGIILKTVTLQPRLGNPPPRIFETPSGMLNAIGLQNVGLENFISEKLPAVGKYPCAIIANIAGETIEEFQEIADVLSDHERIDALELNVSCPNLREGGRSFGHSIKTLETVVSVVRTVSTKPIIVKLSPNVSDIEQYAHVAQESGADIISAVNTYVGMVIDIHTARPVLANSTGGVSGPAIRPLALSAVWRIAQKVSIPIIGIGGITTLHDALEFFMAGASAVQIGTANFKFPNTAARLTAELEHYLKKHNYDSLQPLIGCAHIKETEE